MQEAIGMNLAELEMRLEPRQVVSKDLAKGILIPHSGVGR